MRISNSNSKQKKGVAPRDGQ